MRTVAIPSSIYVYGSAIHFLIDEVFFNICKMINIVMDRSKSYARKSLILMDFLSILSNSIAVMTDFGSLA